MLRTPQGTEFRAVLQISRADDQSLSATVRNADAVAQALQTKSVTQQGLNINIVMATVNVTFEAKLSADGNTMSGTWHSATDVPVVLTRATPDTAWAIPEAPPPPKPMADDSDPGIEVSTIKPSAPNTADQSIRFLQGRLLANNKTLAELMLFAYGVHPEQISGAPGWVRTDRFDIVGLPDREGAPNQAQMAAMLRKLLAERFGLRLHREKKELSVFTINVERGGPKLTPAQSTARLPSFGLRGLGTLNARNGTMPEFAELMQAYLVDRPVLDKTGIMGRFDFTLTWRPEQVPAGNAELDDRPDLITAMKEQLGLRFAAERAPTDILVIDRVEKPSEN
jgi:uncharacterized protein (TIGR03435 family)